MGRETLHRKFDNFFKTFSLLIGTDSERNRRSSSVAFSLPEVHGVEEQETRFSVGSILDSISNASRRIREGLKFFLPT